MYQPPTPITPQHSVVSFRCGKPALEAWLRNHALHNEGRTARTYVVTHGGDVVVAYYTLANGRIELRDLPRKLRHNQPGTIPVVILGRLAVDQEHGGHGLGGYLLREAMIRTLEISRISGVLALVVHAIDDEAITFYTHYGFLASPLSPMTLILPVGTIQKALPQSDRTDHEICAASVEANTLVTQQNPP
jgi:GNAT superfamily N-acetyltransferase